MEVNIIGRRMKSLRENKDLKQNKVADELNVSSFQLSRYESGKSKPDPDLIAKIAIYYNVSTDYLLGTSDDPRMTAEQEFQAFRDSPDLQVFYRELPESEEEEVRILFDMWQIIKKNKEK